MFKRAVLTLTAVILSTAYVSAKDIIRNGGFEDETPGVPPGFCMWGAEEFKKPENYTRDTNNPHSGKACLRIFHPANTRGYIISSPSDNVVKWKPDASYTFSFWAKTDKPGKTSSVSFSTFTSLSPFTSGPSFGDFPLELDKNWKQFSFTFVEGTDFTADSAPYFCIVFFPTTKKEEEKTVWIDDIRLEEKMSSNPNASPASFLSEIKTKFPFPASVPQFKAGDVVVCGGDSITHYGKYHKYLSLFYATRFPDRKVMIWNAGISGNVTQDLIERFDADIAWRKPTVFTVMLGMNDASNPSFGPNAKLEDLKPAMEKTLSKYQENLSRIIDKAKALNAVVILFTPSPYDQTADIPAANLLGKNDALKMLVDNLHAYSSKSSLPLVDLYAPMQYITVSKQAVFKNFTFGGKDRTHPNEAGHLIMAYSLLKSQGISPFVSRIGIDAKSPKADVENAKVENLKVDGKKISFECTGNALPYPVESKAALALRMIPFTEDLNRETLTVTGLDAGKYSLSIDGIEVGTYDAAEFSAGVNLATNQKTPQYKQALSVSAICDKRYDKEIGLRSIVFFESEMRKAKVDLNNANAVRKYMDGVSSWRKDIVPLYYETKPKIDAVVAEVKSLNDKMYEVAKPVKHSYLLSPVR